MLILDIPIVVVYNYIVPCLDICDVLALRNVCSDFEGVTKYISWLKLEKTYVWTEITKVNGASLHSFPWLKGCRGINIFNSKEIKSLNGCEVNRAILLELSLHKCKDLLDNDISGLCNLEILRLPRCREITNEGIKDLTKLRILDLSTAMKVSDRGIYNMIHMEELRLFFNLRVSMFGVKRMANLRFIHMAYNRLLNEKDLRKMFAKLETVFVRQF